MNTVTNRIAALRQSMMRAGVAACIVYGTDPHASEYLAECWKDREWISGFSGSAGTVVVALKSAGLWTDSRYFLQGEQQLSGSGIALMKQGLPETPDIVSWLKQELKAGDKVAVNAQLLSVSAYAALQTDLAKAGIELVNVDLISGLWTDRPAVPQKPLFVFDEKYAGFSVTDKLAALRAEMKKMNTDIFVLSALDDIAWLYNVRGGDVDYNPVVIAYSLVTMQDAVLFVSPEKVNSETHMFLTSHGVRLADYHAVYSELKHILPDKTVLIDGAKLNRSLYEMIPTECRIVNAMSPVFRMKSIKNTTEISGIRRAMVKDGVALTKFFKWLEENVASGKLTELTVAEKLYKFRAEQENFAGESFETIAGYGAHGAIVHYSATEESAAHLQADGLFLLDSGGQYYDGTTDITRTISLGNPTEEQKQDFSLVLKGHIALAKAVFPVNTRGSQLDILARKPMWERGVNYGHGTGHGVGHFLNVHEGPQSIRMDENPVVLQEGMYISNEPGLYRTGKHGIRTENLVLVAPATETAFGKFLCFETVTLCYIDTTLLDRTILNGEDIKWLNDYHNRVFEMISPLLNIDEAEWLRNKCKPV